MRDLTPARARAIASTAYIFLYPLVMNYREMYLQAVDQTSATYSGGFGTWRHMRDPRDHHILRSSLWLDVRSEPWWCHSGGASRDANVLIGWNDLWGFGLAFEETIDEKYLPDSVLVSAPAKVKDVPTGIGGIMRGSSGFVALRTEIYLGDADTIPTRPLAEVEPVSVRFGRPAPQRAAAVPWRDCRMGSETTDDFWSCANFALSLVSADGSDELVLESISEIGVVAGQPWNPSSLSDEVTDAIYTGMDDAISDMLATAAQWTGWSGRHLTRHDMDRDYFRRALHALCAVDAPKMFH